MSFNISRALHATATDQNGTLWHITVRRWPQRDRYSYPFRPFESGDSRLVSDDVHDVEFEAAAQVRAVGPTTSYRWIKRITDCHADVVGGLEPQVEGLASQRGAASSAAHVRMRAAAASRQ